jgi:hypothetical protein
MHHTNTAVIAGAVGAGVFALLLLGGAIAYYLSKRHHYAAAPTDDDDLHNLPSTNFNAPANSGGYKTYFVRPILFHMIMNTYANLQDTEPNQMAVNPHGQAVLHNHGHGSHQHNHHNHGSGPQSGNFGGTHGTAGPPHSFGNAPGGGGNAGNAPHFQTQYTSYNNIGNAPPSGSGSSAPPGSFGSGGGGPSAPPQNFGYAGGGTEGSGFASGQGMGYGGSAPGLPAGAGPSGVHAGHLAGLAALGAPAVVPLVGRALPFIPGESPQQREMREQAYLAGLAATPYVLQPGQGGSGQMMRTQRPEDDLPPTFDAAIASGPSSIRDSSYSEGTRPTSPTSSGWRSDSKRPLL